MFHVKTVYATNSELVCKVFREKTFLFRRQFDSAFIVALGLGLRCVRVYMFEIIIIA